MTSKAQSCSWPAGRDPSRSPLLVYASQAQLALSGMLCKWEEPLQGRNLEGNLEADLGLQPFLILSPRQIAVTRWLDWDLVET